MRYIYSMQVEPGGRGIYIPLENDPVLLQRRENIFIQLALGLIGSHNHPDATRLAAIFREETLTDDQRQEAIHDLRFIVRDLSNRPGSRIPTLGNVLGKAYEFADEDPEQVQGHLCRYLENHQPKPSPFFLTRRTSPVQVDVA